MGLYKRAVKASNQDAANAAFLDWYSKNIKPSKGKGKGTTLRFLTQVAPDQFMEETVELPGPLPEGMTDDFLANMLNQEEAIERAEAEEARQARQSRKPRAAAPKKRPWISKNGLIVGGGGLLVMALLGLGRYLGPKFDKK